MIQLSSTASAIEEILLIANFKAVIDLSKERAAFQFKIHYLILVSNKAVATVRLILAYFH